MSYPRSPLSFFSIILVIACLGLVLSGCQQDLPREDSVLVMQRHVSFSETGFIDKQMGDGCNIAKDLSDDIRYHAKQQYSRIDLADTVSANTPGTALFVKVSILKAEDTGSSWAGRRYMTVEGTLWHRGARVGNFIAQRESRQTVDPCMSLARVSRALGKDIGQWLASPKLNARLGDMK